MDEGDILSALSALAQETRLRIVRRLVRAGPQGLTAGDLAEAVGASPSRASFHLAALAEAGLIRADRVSRQIVYRADFEGLGALVGALLHECCEGHPTVLACCAKR